MSIQGILLIVLIFVCILVLPVVFVLRSPDENEADKPENVDRRLRETAEYAAVRGSARVREMTALVQSIPYVTRATLRAERFQLERCIDRIGELEKIEGKGIDLEPPLTGEQMELYRLALEDSLAPEYFSSPIWVGKKKERHKEGYYIYLDPQITGKVVDERTKEAIYNGERTSDI